MARKQKNVFVFENHKQLANFAVRRWLTVAKKAIRDHGYFAAILSGGKTPDFFYRKLAAFRQTKIWQKTHVFWADERFVSRRHSWNNYRMVSKNLLQDVPILRSHIHPISVTEKTVQLSALKYEKDLRVFFKLAKNKIPKFDLAILGVGEDGHTASLFPVDSQWRTKKRLAISVVSPRVKFKRISLTLPVLNCVANVFFFVIGKKKATILHRMLRGDEKLPVAHVKPKQGKRYILADKQAGCFTKGE